ncbi:MAG: hypothetical protein K6A42_11765 [Treponema sp.]|nr:hypothetical protein [Treponema sp.]
MKTAIDQARYLMNCRDFAAAIQVLNEKRQVYEESFDYHYTLGLAFLYAGDTGSAAQSFEAARKIKINNTNLLQAQAAIYLRRGDTERAVQYYLDILDLDPQNKGAKKALEFVRTHGDYEEICRWVDSGKIELYYPPLGPNPKKIKAMLLTLFVGALCGALAVRFWPKDFSKSSRADLSSLVLSVDDSVNARGVKKSYNQALEYFDQKRDNAAQREVNKVLNSKASTGLKQKARTLMSYFEAPSFDTLKDNFSYQEVAAQSALYLDCWVDWSGRVSNLIQGEKSLSFDLLVGYEDLKDLEGIVRVDFDFIPDRDVDPEKPVRVLGKVDVDGSKIVLKGRSIYQSVKDF